MKTAAIVIDPWKLPIFERHLSQSGYSYTQHDGPVKDTLTLRVTTSNLEALGIVVKAANTEAARTKH